MVLTDEVVKTRNQIIMTNYMWSHDLISNQLDKLFISIAGLPVIINTISEKINLKDKDLKAILDQRKINQPLGKNLLRYFKIFNLMSSNFNALLVSVNTHLYIYIYKIYIDMDIILLAHTCIYILCIY